MSRFFALGLVALPLLEIAVFILVGQAIGLLPTLALVVLAALVGTLLLRQQGLGFLSRMRANVDSTSLPQRTVFDAMALGLAALLLVLPGFLSDIAALALLLPPTRDLIFTLLSRHAQTLSRTTTTSYRRRPDPDEPDEPNERARIEIIRPPKNER